MVELLMKKPGFGTLLIGAALGWLVLCVVWLFCGSGYQFVQPSAYEFTTRILLSSPETAAEARGAMQAHGYLSIVEQNRLFSRIAQ